MTFAVSDRFSTGWSNDLSSSFEGSSTNDLSLTSVGLKDGVSLTQPWEIWEGPTTGPTTGPTLQPPQPQPVYEPITVTTVLVGLGIAVIGGIIAGVASNEINRALHPEDRKPPPPPPVQPTQPPPNPQEGIIITPIPPKQN